MQVNTQSDCKAKKQRSFKSSAISIVLFTIITLAIFSAQTYAYFTDSASSRGQQIAAGNLDVEIVEMQSTESGQAAQMDPVKIMPATSVSKTVKVKNTGTLPIYVRIKIEKAIDKSADELPVKWMDYISCNFFLDDETTGNVEEGPWTFSEGYYYYHAPLMSGAVTEPLFDTVSFSPNMGNQFENSEIRLTVVCQATQSNGNTSSAVTAVGWPAAS